jgi:NAD(P)-dependent dehydrogenase (short-subunit alcohol dehydrogenase family)
MTRIMITGAARGIGNTLVTRAIDRGDIVFACVRKEEDFSKFPKSENCHLVLMDVGSTESVKQAFLEVDKLLDGQSLDVIINPAAVAGSGVLEVTPVEEFEQHYNTNTLGSLRIIQNALPRLRGHGGRLILVTSLWGRAAAPMVGAYCSSKHAVEALADVARRESIDQNLHIIVAQPGVVLTDMYTQQAEQIKVQTAALTSAQGAIYGNLYRRYLKMVESGSGAAITAEIAAQNIEKAVFAKNPRRRYQFGMDSKVVCFLNWLLPTGVMDFLLGLSLNNKSL